MQTHLDLFTGIGGFHLAAGWAGFQTVGFSEIDPYCCALLTDKWPHIKNYGNIKTADFSEFIGRIDVLSAGVPCQPASLAGGRGGEKDDRWLWPATCDVVKLIQPIWCIFENPLGILSLGEFGGILARLENSGYEIQIFQVSANSVGAKHKRERVFVVAHSECVNGERRSAGRREEISFRPCDAANGSSYYSEVMANPQSAGLGAYGAKERDQPQLAEFSCGAYDTHWRNLCLTKPPLCRATDGIPNRSHRIKSLGNAVVPQQAAPFFQAIAEVERAL